MKGCFRCITDCFTPRSDQSFLFVNDTEEGIEFERLIELPEHILQTGAAPPVINERERHLISHRLYAEYCDDEEQHAVLKEQELLREEEQLAIEEEDYYNNKAKKVQDYYNGSDHKRSASLNNYVVFEDFPARTKASTAPENLTMRKLLDEDDFEKFLKIIKEENSLQAESTDADKNASSNDDEGCELDSETDLDIDYCM